MPRHVIVIVSNGGISNREYREKLRKLWKLAAKFNFEPHGFSSVFTGPDGLNLEMFLTFLEAQGLKYYVEKGDGFA